jgi:hypothetical protein
VKSREEPTFLRRLKVREHSVGWLAPCPDLHASSGFSVLIRADEKAGRYRFQCVEAEPGDLCSNERELVKLLELEEAELSLNAWSTLLPSLDLDEFLGKEPTPPPWDWTGYHARGDLVLVVGDPGIGKSMVCLSNAAQAVSGGGEQFGEPVAQARVLFLDLESPEDVVYSRLRAFGITGNVDGFDYTWRPPGFDLLAEGGIEKLKDKIIATGCEVLYLDSLRRAAPGLEENDSRAVGLLLSELREVARLHVVTIIVIHHPRKPADGTRLTALAAARGSGDLTASVDSYSTSANSPAGSSRSSTARHAAGASTRKSTTGSSRQRAAGRASSASTSNRAGRRRPTSCATYARPSRTSPRPRRRKCLASLTARCASTGTKSHCPACSTRSPANEPRRRDRHHPARAAAAAQDPARAPRA